MLISINFLIQYRVLDLTDARGSFSLSGFGKNVIIFCAGMSSSVHNDNRKKGILILSKGLTGGLDDATWL